MNPIELIGNSQTNDNNSSVKTYDNQINSLGTTQTCFEVPLNKEEFNFNDTERAQNQEHQANVVDYL